MRIRRHRLRQDIPATLRELYPTSRTVGRRLEVVPPAGHRGRVVGLPWRMIGATTAILLFCGALFLVEELVSEDARVLLLAAAGPVLYLVDWLLSGCRTGWEGFARARDLRPVAAPVIGSIGGDAVQNEYHAVVGPRRVGVTLGLAVGEAARTSYVARVALPARVGRVFGMSRLDRLDRNTAIDGASAGLRPLQLESERLVRQARLLVDEGDPLPWSQLFDPALVDLLAEGIDVEWSQSGSCLLLLIPVPMAARRHVHGPSFDTLCVAAAALERRFATIVGDGIAVPPVPYERPAHAGGAQPATRYVARERQRDLSLDPEQLFAELARLTTAAEVASVRAKVDAGTFPLEWLDDLVHHRRARLWGQSDAA